MVEKMEGGRERERREETRILQEKRRKEVKALWSTYSHNLHG